MAKTALHYINNNCEIKYMIKIYNLFLQLYILNWNVLTMSALGSFPIDMCKALGMLKVILLFFYLRYFAKREEIK